MNKENSDTYSVTCRCPRILIFVLAAALVFGAVCVGGVSAWSADTTWGSNYNSESVFYIDDAGDLAQFATMVNSGKDFTGKRVVLNADIDLENQVWTSIGNQRSTPFRGTFDGNGHIISHLYQEVGFLADTMVGGLFGYVSGTIFDVTVTQSTLKTKGMPTVGFVIGVLISGNVNQCVVTSSEITTTFWGWIGSLVVGCTIGGVVGENEEGIVYDTTTMDDVVFPSIFGSLFGDVYNYEIVGNGKLTPSEEDDTFTVTATAGENGIIIPSGELLAAKGSSITYGFTPDSGFVIDKIIVDGNDVTSSCLSTNTYTFENIKADHTISATFKEGIGYIITIPDKLIISEETEKGTMDIIPTYLWIPETSSLEVKVVSTNNFELVSVDDTDITLAYALKQGNTRITARNNVVAAFTMDNLNTVTLSAELTGEIKYAGEYSDTLTFSVEVEQGIA